jgi:hypothetical protein
MKRSGARAHVVGLLATIALSAAPAAAFSRGAPGQSGAQDTNCKSCHGGNNAPAPSITLDGFSGPFVQGREVVFSITVHANDRGGGTGGCAQRCAGFTAGVDAGGKFIQSGAGTQVVNGGLGDVTHTARTPFDANGNVTYQVKLALDTAGQHTLFVAGNDVNGSGTGGDRVGLLEVPFTVEAADGDPPATEPVVAPDPPIEVPEDDVVTEPPSGVVDEPGAPAAPNDDDASSANDADDAQDEGTRFEARALSCDHGAQAAADALVIVVFALLLARLRRRRGPRPIGQR